MPANYGLVDWLRVSKPRCANGLQKLRQDCVDFLTSCGETVTWGHGYDCIDVAGYGKFCSRETEVAGQVDVLVDLPGQAMEFIRRKLGYSDAATCNFFEIHGFTGKRLDGAIDTRARRVTPRFVFDLCDPARDLMVGESQKARWVESRDLSNWEEFGTTCYIGGLTSSRFMRIYDKVKEKLAKTGEALTDEDGNLVDHLTRFEMQCNDEAADYAMRQVSFLGLDAIPGLFRGWIDFKDPKSRAETSRVHRAKSAKWWLAIAGKGVELRPGLHRAGTPEKTMMWLKKGCAPAVLLARKYGAGDEFEAAVASSAPSKIKRAQWEAWQKSRDEKRAASGGDTRGQGVSRSPVEVVACAGGSVSSLMNSQDC